MKRFFRFWATIGPHSQPTASYTYAADLLAAVEKIEQRLIDEYGGSATLTARVEEFELQDANRFAKTSVAVSQCMIPADVEEVCTDLESVDPATLDNPTARIAEDFRYQLDTIKTRRGGQLVAAGDSTHRRHRHR